MMTDTLQHIAAIVHAGGLAGLDEHAALCAVRRLTLGYWDRTQDEAGERLAAIVAVRASECPGVGRLEPERTVASIPDADLLRRVVRHVVRSRPHRKAFAWATVSEAFALGSTFAAQLCRRFDLDPDTGAATKSGEEKHDHHRKH